jgi:hypothetical protein
MNKSEIYQGLYEATELPDVLISIIYFYVRNFIERYKTTINCVYNNDPINLNEITILGKSLYVLDRMHMKIFVYNTDTYELLHVIENSYALVITMNHHIEKYLEVKSSDLQYISILKNYSGFYPDNNNKFKNFWTHGRYNDIETYSDKYKVLLNSIFDDIIIFNKTSDEQIHILEQKYQYLTLPRSRQKNITVYDNILYIIGTVRYESIIDGYFIHNYIHLYDLDTFEFIRGFGSNDDKLINDDIFRHVPEYIAFKDDTIFVSTANSKIDVWVREECL